MEIQQESEGALPQRARYYSGLLDMNTPDPGKDYEELPETYMIFITQEDVLGDDLPIYHIDRRAEETGRLFHDKSHMIYVNSADESNTDLGRLMHDFHCRNAAEMYSPILAKRVQTLKETPEEVEKCARKCRRSERMDLEKAERKVV